MDVDEDDKASSYSRAQSELSALDQSWLKEKDAPLALPLRPTASGYGNYHDFGSRSNSRAASRATSRGVRSAAGDGEDSDGTFPHGSAAASLFTSPAPTEAAVGSLGESSEAKQALAPLFFFQLPTTLPLKPGATLNGDPASALSGPEYLAALAGKANAPASSLVKTDTNADGSAKAMGDAPVDLRSLGDGGQLGELVVRRSGKVCLQIGGLMLDVQPGTICSVDQEIVSMGVPEEPGGKVDLHRLGKMHERFVVTPNVDDLLGLGTR